MGKRIFFCLMRTGISPHKGVNGIMLFNNAYLHEGFLQTISLVNLRPEMADAMSPYSFRARTDPKEQIWERVRLETDTNLPSRAGAFFVFSNEDAAKKISSSWFQNEDRHLVKARKLQVQPSLRPTPNCWKDARKIGRQMLEGICAVK